MAGRKKVSFEEVSATFDEVKGVLGREDAQLKPVAGDDKKCCVVSGDSVKIESLSAMANGLAVIKTLTANQSVVSS